MTCSIPTLPMARTLRSMTNADSEHDAEAEQRQQDVHLQRGDQERQTEDQAEDPPLDPAEGVAVQGGLADLLRERGVALVELLLDLVEDALFVFGERHRPNSLLGGTPVGPAGAIIAQGAGGDNAARGSPSDGARGPFRQVSGGTSAAGASSGPHAC